MKRVALYFGSYNPIHKGHAAVADYVVANGFCDQLWFVVSPQNPLKPLDTLAPEDDRLEMANIALRAMTEAKKMKVSDVEFSMPKPSYTIDTVRFLTDRHPDVDFCIVAGADVISGIERWKEYEELLAKCRFLIYPREGYDLGRHAEEITYLRDAPTWNYSSTQIREKIALGECVTDMLDDKVFEYIKEHRLYGSEKC